MTGARGADVTISAGGARDYDRGIGTRDQAVSNATEGGNRDRRQTAKTVKPAAAARR